MDNSLYINKKKYYIGYDMGDLLDTLECMGLYRYDDFEDSIIDSMSFDELLEHVICKDLEMDEDD